MTIALTGIAELIYHWNINTPYWLGFIFQRPESHRIHHQENWPRFIMMGIARFVMVSSVLFLQKINIRNYNLVN